MQERLKLVIPRIFGILIDESPLPDASGRGPGEG